MCVIQIALSPPGHSSLFPMEDERSFGEDESGDQGLAGLGSAHCFPHLNGERVERYSRKVFVGGLPPDIDEGKDVLRLQRMLLIWIIVDQKLDKLKIYNLFIRVLTM